MESRFAGLREYGFTRMVGAGKWDGREYDFGCLADLDSRPSIRRRGGFGVTPFHRFPLARVCCLFNNKTL